MAINRRKPIYTVAMGRRFAYWLLGFALGACLFALALLIFPKHVRDSFDLWITFFNVGNCCGLSIVGLAERRGKVQSGAELRKPLTLFPKV